ncbi:MAG: hypothetical protein K2Q10_01350, partial [Rhodospirillales bacterium]|nr:hypothetical protein [Rhodospirillales bacterium]
MIFGRLCGWLLVALALLMASGDAVLALGPGDYARIQTADVFTLLAGHTPDLAGGEGRGVSVAMLGRMMMQMPAWVVLGPIGASLAYLCRRRRP